jgi:hypothetical protein
MSISNRPASPALWLAALCVTMLGSASVGRAQHAATPSARHTLSFGFGGGVIVPVSDAKDAFSTGVNGQAFVLVQLGQLPALRFNLGYQRFDLKDAIAPTATTTGNTQVLSGVAALSVDLLHGPVRPYVTAGLGGFDVRQALTAASSSTSASAFNFGVDGGAGIAIATGRISAFAEGKVQNVFTKTGGLIDAKSIRSVPVSFGIIVGM